MLLTTLPFDYVLLGSGDRVRTESRRPSGTRARRTPPRDKS